MIEKIYQLSNSGMNTGKREREEVCLKACNSPSAISSKPLYHPIKKPSGIIIITARPNPVKARWRLMLVCIHSSPDTVSLIRASKTSEGGAKNALFIMPLAGNSSHKIKKTSRAMNFLGVRCKLCFFTDNVPHLLPQFYKILRSSEIF